jgi:hypothetical protein
LYYQVSWLLAFFSLAHFFGLVQNRLHSSFAVGWFCSKPFLPTKKEFQKSPEASEDTLTQEVQVVSGGLIWIRKAGKWA